MDKLEFCRNIHHFIIYYKKHIIFLKNKYFCPYTQYKEYTDK